MPMIATRLPVRSTSWFQRAEWKTSPWKDSMPSISGSFGSDRPPAPLMTVRAAYVPSVVSTIQRWRPSSQTASLAAVSKTNRSSVPDSSATRLM